MLKIIAFLVLSLFVACGGGSDNSDSSGGSASLSTKSYAASSNSNREVTVDFNIGEGENAFQLVATTASAIRLTSITGPNGSQLFDLNNARVTGANQPQNFVNTFNYPILPSQGLPLPGVYRVKYAVASSGQPLDLRVLTKQDSSFSEGRLRVNVVILAPINQSDENLDGIEFALNFWKANFAQAGVELEFIRHELDGPTTLPNPVIGSSYYESLTASLPSNAITVVFGVDVEDIGSRENALAAVGSLPLPLVSSPRSVIAVSVRRAVGSDGRFDFEDRGATNSDDDDESRLLGEALSHEAGHALGLFDTVTFSGSTVVASDLLDTQSCLTLRGCELDGGSARNIMFPFPVRDRDTVNETLKRDALSPDQRRVVNFYVGVL